MNVRIAQVDAGYRFEVVDEKGLVHAVSSKTFTSPVRASQTAAAFGNKALGITTLTPESVPFKKGHAPVAKTKPLAKAKAPIKPKK